MLYISRTVFPVADLQCSPYIVQLVTDTPVIVLKTVEDLMRSTEELKRNLWGPVYKEEWISKWTYPNRLSKDKEVTFDGMRYRVYDFGAGGDSCEFHLDY
ncbi:MAG: hypothetical protein WA421_09595 [Nitrososphaeraceae archaeon]